MSEKKRDRHNRWRSKPVCFMMSPEEKELFDRYAALSGLTKREYMNARALNREIKVHPNPRVYKALKAELDRIVPALEAFRDARAGNLELIEELELLETIVLMIRQMGAQNE